MTSHPKPFRFGVQTAKTRTAEEWREAARKAEALGFDIFQMPDHLGSQLAIGPALAVVAEVSTTIRIGTLVWQNDLRHPTLLAKEAYTLDVLSGGRFELGIGAGGSFPPEFEWIGVPLESAKDRVDRVEESIRILKGVAGSDPFSFEGTHYTISEYEGHPKPVQQPHPPFFIGAGGPRMLRIAAREADIIGVLPMFGAGATFDEQELGPDAFEQKVGLVREIAGERFDRIEFNILVQALAVADGRDAAIERLRQERGFDNDIWFESPMVLAGSIDEIVETMEKNRERLNISYYTVFEHNMDEFAPIVARLAGR